MSKWKWPFLKRQANCYPEADGDIFVIRYVLPIESSRGYTWSICKIKIPNGVHPYLAFRTKDLADEALERNKMGDSCCIIPIKDLDQRYWFDFDSSPIILFESRHEMEEFFSAPAAYDYEASLWKVKR